MPFPIIALALAAASDAQQRAAKGDAVFQDTQNALSNIRQHRVAELGGNPYYGMVANFRSGLNNLDRQFDNSRNNHIGELLAAYLKKDKGLGDKPDPSGFGDEMGTAQVDDWDTDPWGDAGF